MTPPYEYRLIDPERLDASPGAPVSGTNEEVLRDGLLDVIHVALESGITHDDVDGALAQVLEHVARLSRSRFRVLRPTEDEG
jgi:hypothetical protein